MVKIFVDFCALTCGRKFIGQEVLKPGEEDAEKIGSEQDAGGKSGGEATTVGKEATPST